MGKPFKVVTIFWQKINKKQKEYFTKALESEKILSIMPRCGV